MSDDLKATVLVTVLMIVLVTVPVLILRFTQSQAAEVHKAIAAWGASRGLTPSSGSALPPSLVRVYSSVVSFVWRGGVLSVLSMPHRGGLTTTLWARAGGSGAERAKATAYAHARRFGASVGHSAPEQTTGDAAFDAAFMSRGESAEAVRAVLDASVRRALLATPDLETFSWDGERWSVTLHGTRWQEGLALIERVQPR